MTEKKVCAFKKYMVLELLVFFAILALDIFFKRYSEINLKDKPPQVFISGVINLVYVENTGAAFGILRGKQTFFLILSVIALAFFMVFLYLKRKENILLRLALVFITGGTAGNFIDRAKAGFVIDMIELDFIDFAVFNIADSALTVGVIMFAVYYLFIYKEPEKKEKNQNGDIINE